MRTRGCGALVGLVLGCGASAAPPASTPVSYLRATPIIEYGAPSVGPSEQGGGESGGRADGAAEPTTESATAEDGEDASVLDGERSSDGGPAPRTTPSAVIAHANAMASQSPEEAGFLNAVMTYTFVPGGIYQVFTAPENVTDLVLEPGEEIMGEPAAGDTLRWKLGIGTSAVGGVPQKHVFVKPTRPGLATNLTLNTNRRTYFLKLESIEKDCMVAVQWTYPQSETGAPMASGVPTTTKAKDQDGARRADVTDLNFDYSVEVVNGKPRWKPQEIYDDGQKTFIRFDPSMLHGESPVLFVIERGEMQLVNYRMKKNLYVVDRLFDVAELRLGQDDQDVVRIRKAKKAARR